METLKSKKQLSPVAKAVIVGAVIVVVGGSICIKMHKEVVSNYESITHSILRDGVTISDSKTDFNVLGGNATTTYKLDLNKLSKAFNKDDYLYVVAKTELNSQLPLNVNASTTFYLKAKDLDQEIKTIVDNGISFSGKDGKVMPLKQLNGEVLLPVTINYDNGKTIADLLQINFKDRNDGTQLTIGASQLSYSQDDGVDTSTIIMPSIKVVSPVDQTDIEIKGLSYTTSDNLLNANSNNPQKLTGFNKGDLEVKNITYVSNERYNKKSMSIDDLVLTSDFNVAGSKGDLAFKTTIGEIKYLDDTAKQLEKLTFNMDLKNIDVNFVTKIADILKHSSSPMNQNEKHQLLNKIAPLIPNIKNMDENLKLTALVNDKAVSLNMTAKPNANFINYPLANSNLIQYQLNHNVNFTAKLNMNKTLANEYFSAAQVDQFIIRSKAVVDGDMIKANVAYLNGAVHFPDVETHKA
ncbi:hypothetical protein [Photobacterium carnosum]|uniref:hypothetical protein n=1 Tax=Photobacterium carnosum TaxID=2023717 RepID=UPI001E655CF9|nr:hypothetical protein [Photobacterium carnosum]MCD9527548.1 hypothetical protein [Photobacterium carnosum]